MTTMMTMAMTMATQVSIPDETVKFSYDSQRQYILFQGTEVWSSWLWWWWFWCANNHHDYDDYNFGEPKIIMIRMINIVILMITETYQKHNRIPLCQIMQGKAQTGSYMKAIVIRTGFMTTKVQIWEYLRMFYDNQGSDLRISQNVLWRPRFRVVSRKISVNFMNTETCMVCLKQ